MSDSLKDKRMRSETQRSGRSGSMSDTEDNKWYDFMTDH